MKPCLITGPESLLKAAYEELTKAEWPNKIANGAATPYDCLYLYKHGFWLDADPFNSGETHLTLPADWDKLMGILAELKKPKLPEYVRHYILSVQGEVGKVVSSELVGAEPQLPIYNVLDPYGKEKQWPTFSCGAITEQEFIEGGLKELAEAGYVKGAKVATPNSGAATFQVDEVDYRKKDGAGAWSGDTYFEAHEKGFCFAITGHGWGVPVGKCTLVPALPTTPQGIPYTLADGYLSLGKDCISATILQVSTLRHLLRQNVTELVTKAGRLTQADLELLTK